jgi:hypothetical protein
VTLCTPAGRRARAIEMSEGSVRQVRSSADDISTEPSVTTNAARPAALLPRSADLCVWTCATALAAARTDERSMMEGMSSFSRRRAIRSTLVMGASGIVAAPSTASALGRGAQALGVITGNEIGTSTHL